jgi:hypothetical protein
LNDNLAAFQSCPLAPHVPVGDRSHCLRIVVGLVLCDIDVPWVDDQQRDMPHRREEFMTRCRHELETHGRHYVVIRGDWKTRFQTAVDAIDKLLACSLDARPVAAQNRLLAEIMK